MTDPDGLGVIVVGAGGHAKVIIELLRANGEEVAFCVSATGEEGSTCLGVPVLIGDSQALSLRDRGYSRAFVAIGHNPLRQTLAEEFASIGFGFVNAISPRATVSPTARLGVGIAIMAGAVINADVEIGDHSIINTLASVDHDGVIGAAVHIAPNAALAGNVRLLDRVFLGIGSTVLPGVTIGSDVKVGAGSVVLTEVVSGTVAGVPARPLHSRTT